MKHFTLQELTATRTGLENNPSPEVIENLENLVDKVLDPLREKYGKPITVTTGYRSAKVNARVGGKGNSQHLTGEAADITGGSAEENKKIFELIQSMNLPFDQLIDECNFRWVHVSSKKSGINRKQILHLK